MADAPIGSDDGIVPIVINDPTVTANTAQVFANRSLSVQQLQKATYSSASTITMATSATDVFTITGSATKLVKVLRIQVSGIKTVAGQELVALLKRSSANTGGTFTSAAGFIVPHDSTSAANTNTVGIYTANPTGLGVQVGFIRTCRIFSPATSSIVTPTIQLWDFTDAPDQNIVLRGVAEVLAINMQASSVAGDILFVSVDWTEE